MASLYPKDFKVVLKSVLAKQMTELLIMEVRCKNMTEEKWRSGFSVWIKSKTWKTQNKNYLRSFFVKISNYLTILS